MMAESARIVLQVFLTNVAQWPLSATATAAAIMSAARLVQPWPVKRQIKNIRRLFENISPEAFLAEPDMMLIQLEAAIINDWNESVRSHYEANPFTEEELDCVSEKAGASYRSGHRIERAYGATLIAAAVTRDYWFGIQIGDGKCAAFDEAGICTQPIPWDEKCFLNKTTSICGSDALRDFRHFYSGENSDSCFYGVRWH